MDTFCKFRVDPELLKRAHARAAEEGTDISVLGRQWLTDLAAGRLGENKIRYNAAEQEAVQRAVADLLPNTRAVIDAVVDAINGERLMSREPVQTCQVCGDREVAVLDGRGGFPPDVAKRRLAKRCANKGHLCQPQYTAGIR